MFKKGCVLLFSLLPLMASAISLKDHYPQNYVVKPGDTVYEIAEKYLNKPWEWKQIWRSNPDLKNPKKLYPGAVLTLEYVDGYPRLKQTRRGTFKLSPHSRPRPAQKAIPPVHLSEIKPFLNGSKVFDEDELKYAPYIIGYVGEHLVGAQNNQIYVKNLMRYSGKNSGLAYTIYRPDGVYTRPGNKNELLGYIATYIGDSELLVPGEPAKMLLTSISRGVHVKDRLFPNFKPEYPYYFEPQAPKQRVGGTVIDLLGGLTQVASNQVVVVDQGKREKLKQGDVIALFQPSYFIKDPLHKGKEVLIPKERIGEAMVFKVFSLTSYALVVRSTRAINKFDIFSNP